MTFMVGSAGGLIPRDPMFQRTWSAANPRHPFVRAQAAASRIRAAVQFEHA